MATVPETTDDRNQPIIKKVIEVVQNAASSKKTRERVLVAIAASFAALAPLPYGPVAAGLLVLAATEGR
jgi:hypothetical protein